MRNVSSLAARSFVVLLCIFPVVATGDDSTPLRGFEHGWRQANRPVALEHAREQTLVLTPIEAREQERGLLASGAVSIVPAAAFSSAIDPGSQRFVFSSGLMTGTDPPGQQGCIKASLPIPNDSYITRVSVTLIDDDPGGGLSITLYRVHSSGGGFSDMMARVLSSGSSSSLQVLTDSSIFRPRVDKPSYAYYLAGCLPSPDVGLLSVRVFYNIWVFGDGFESGSTDAWTATVGNAP